jgi:hypothetical protein
MFSAKIGGRREEIIILIIPNLFVDLIISLFSISARGNTGSDITDPRDYQYFDN